VSSRCDRGGCGVIVIPIPNNCSDRLGYLPDIKKPALACAGGSGVLAALGAQLDYSVLPEFV
jgi:hypothetical protein